MNIKQIRELAEIAQQNGLTELEYVEGDAKIRLARAGAAPALQPPAAAVPVERVPSVPVAADSPVDFNKTIEVKSSLIGVFYAAPAPDKEPFVRVGSRVKKGDVLCIIEAMKLMNEIVAEQSGEVVDICVQNGDVVEFGQTLFKLC